MLAQIAPPTTLPAASLSASLPTGGAGDGNLVVRDVEIEAAGGAAKYALPYQAGNEDPVVGDIFLGVGETGGVER